MVETRQLVASRQDWSAVDAYTPSRATTAGIRLSRRQSADCEHLALARTIESEIIPRLMLTHRIDVARDAKNSRGNDLLADVSVGDCVVTLADLALDRPLDVGVAFLQSMQRKGASAESLFIDVISPAARRLGELWKADIRDFTDVTVALTRLQGMMCELTPAFENQDVSRFSSRTVLLAPCPGEQHSLGLLMVQEFFRRAGWYVHPTTPKDMGDLKELVRKSHFDIVGFSVGCEIFTDAVKFAIQVTRRHSKNRAVGIIVGGRLFNDHPELVAAVGADATAVDGREAIQRLPSLLGMSASIC